MQGSDIALVNTKPYVRLLRQHDAVRDNMLELDVELFRSIRDGTNPTMDPYPGEAELEDARRRYKQCLKTRIRYPMVVLEEEFAVEDDE